MRQSFRHCCFFFSMVPLSVPLSLILRKVNARYESGKKEYQQNHLLNIDDLKLFSKSEDQIDTF